MYFLREWFYNQKSGFEKLRLTSYHEILDRKIAVAEEFKGLDKGLYEDYETVYAEKQEKLKKAGKDIIREEVERQYNEWKSAQ